MFIVACAPMPARNDSGSTTISIIGTNDFHGALIPGTGYGGLPAFAGYLGNLRALRESDGGGVLLIDAGDMWQGTLESNLSEGASVVQAYEALQYDAVAIGNHEFDFGPVGPLATPESDSDDAQGALRARAADAAFPFLAANLIDLDTNRPVDWDNVTASIMIDKAGVSVGIVGAITQEALSTTMVANTRGLKVADLLPTVQREAANLRDLGADVVILAAHEGGACKNFDDPDDLTSCYLNDEIFSLATALPTGLVDVIVGGHIHDGIAHNVNGISIISSFSNGRAFGRVDLAINPRHPGIINKTVFTPEWINELQAGNDSTPTSYAGLPVTADKAVEAVISQAVDTAKKFKERPLGILIESDFRETKSPDSAPGNLLVDVMLDVSDGADIAIHNTLGGLRAGIAAGPLTYGDVYEMFPFDNVLVHIRMDGAALKRVFERQLQNGRWRAGLSGLRLQARCQGSKLDITLIKDDGSVVQDEDQLLVATTDFLATGGDDVFTPIMPVGGFEFSANAPRYRDKLIEWMELHGGTLRPADFHDPSNRRYGIPGEAPVTCPPG